MSIKKNTLWNLIGSGAPMLVGVFTIPYLISALGIEAFGILTLVWALVGYFSFFDFGLGRALTQQIAIKRSSGMEDEIPKIIKAGLLFTALTGLCGGILLFLFTPKLAESWLNISVNLQSSALNSLAIASIGIPFTTLTTGFRGILEGFEDFKAVNILRIILGIANFALPAFVVFLIGSSLEYAVASLVASRFVILIWHYSVVTKKIKINWMAVTLRYSDFKSLMGFGIWMTVSNVISPLMVTADRFVISSVLGAAYVAYYTVPFEVLVRVLIIPGALTAAIFPKITSLLQTDLNGAEKLYSKSIKLVASVLFPVLLVTIACAHFGLSIWISENFADMAWIVTAILAIGIAFNGMAQIPHATIQAAGKVRLTALIHFSELILYVPVLFVALKLFGINGAAIAWVLRVLADFLVLRFFANKIFKSLVYANAA
jgi:O-antigen/teichoic acid export membrane protein